MGTIRSQRLRCGLPARVAVLSGLLLAVAATPAAAAIVGHHRMGMMERMTLARTFTREFRTQAPERPASTGVSYHGGPVLQTSDPYLVFWDPNGAIPGALKDTMIRYFSDVAQASGNGTTVFDVDRQYTDATGFAGQSQSFNPAAQVLDDTDAYPTAGCPPRAPTVSACLTDDQVEQEIMNLIDNGRPMPSGIGPGAPIYFVVLPESVNECTGAGQCATNAFCGYHSYITGGPQPILYAVLPTVSFARGQNPKACQSDGRSAVQEPNGSVADALLSTASHEDNETITDPLLNAWYQDGTQNEIGDMCASTGNFDPGVGDNPSAFLPLLGGDPGAGTAYDQDLAGDHYYLQSVWSNATANCEMRPSPATPIASFAAASSGLTATLDPEATASPDGFTSETWSFGDGTPASFSATSAAPVVVSHTFAVPGTYEVSLSVVDRSGQLAVAREAVSVGSASITAGPAISLPTSSGPASAAEALPSSRAPHKRRSRRRHTRRSHHAHHRRRIRRPTRPHHVRHRHRGHRGRRR
jgi:hypothetical protein